jgi:transketolase C-terminal domain/subunit
MNAKKLVITLVGVPLVAMSSLVFAAEPMQLSDAQMDGVTAGGFADAGAVALAIGSVAATYTLATAVTQVVAAVTYEITTIRLVASASGSASGSSAQ